MTRVQIPLGFQADSLYRFRLQGPQLLRVGPAGVRTLRLLADIYHSCRTRTDGKWPFQLRNHFRRIKSIGATHVLALVVDRTKDRTLRILAIWLRGRAGGTRGTSVVARFSVDPDTQTRKEVARALKRMAAWSQLRKMEADDPSPRVRQMASCRPAQSYEARLAKLTQDLSRLEVTPVEQKLVVSPELDLRNGRPPKSSSFMRMILDRIRRLVREHSL